MATIHEINDSILRPTERCVESCEMRIKNADGSLVNCIICLIVGFSSDESWYRVD